MTPAERAAALARKRVKIMKEMGSRIVWYRVQSNLTQARTAKRAGISERTLRRIESGTRLPSLMVLFQIGKALNADPTEFFPLDNPL